MAVQIEDVIDSREIVKMHKYEKIHFGDDWRSVTQLVTSLKPPFDRERKGAEKAQQRGVPIETIFAEWDAKGEASRETGAAVHSYIRSVMEVDNDPILKLNQRNAKMRVFDNFWSRAMNSLNPIRWEWPIHEDELKIMAQVDALMYHKGTETLHVFDWKTGGFSEWGYSDLNAPFNFLRDSSTVIDSLQCSLYKLVLERTLSVKLGPSYTVYLGDTGYQIYKLDDYGGQLLKWLQSK